MSADSFSVCPRCAERLAKIDPFGGVEETLREYYEFYIDPKTGKFSANYDASCDECEFEFSFNHEEKVPL